MPDGESTEMHGENTYEFHDIKLYYVKKQISVFQDR